MDVRGRSLEARCFLFATEFKRRWGGKEEEEKEEAEGEAFERREEREREMNKRLGEPQTHLQLSGLMSKQSVLGGALYLPVGSLVVSHS